MQDVAQRGIDVLGNTVPDSGTAGRTAAMMGLLSGGGAAAFINPAYLAALGIGLGTGTAAYSKTGQKLANALLTKRPDVVRSAGTAASKYAPTCPLQWLSHLQRKAGIKMPYIKTEKKAARIMRNVSLSIGGLYDKIIKE